MKLDDLSGFNLVLMGTVWDILGKIKGVNRRDTQNSKEYSQDLDRDEGTAEVEFHVFLPDRRKIFLKMNFELHHDKITPGFDGWIPTKADCQIMKPSSPEQSKVREFITSYGVHIEFGVIKSVYENPRGADQ